MKRVAFGVVGMVLVLGWWTLTGKRDIAPSLDKIPSKVWEGGAGQVTVEAESSDPATMHAEFERPDISDPSKRHQRLQSTEKVAAGQHTWTIDVPASTFAILEFEAIGPKTGSKLTWTVHAGGRQIAQESQTLDKPLQANEAFFLQVQATDLASGKLDGE
jgi:hypothetical protein